MKSIMEEASSITKAIENAWIRAGKPHEFKVKIFEQAQKNIFGFTSKPAKIALFFNAEAVTIKEEKPKKKYERTIPFSQKKIEKPIKKRTTPDMQAQASQWTEEMVKSAQDWIKQCLLFMELPNITFTTTVVGNNLKFHFDTSITGNNTQERFLFSSFAHLLMETMRTQFKKPFRSLKVLLHSD